MLGPYRTVPHLALELGHQPLYIQYDHPTIDVIVTFPDTIIKLIIPYTFDQVNQDPRRFMACVYA